MDKAALNRAYFDTGEWARTWYRGIPIFKYPSDLFVYDLLIRETKPDVIIETGTLEGGSAWWFADHSDAQVLSIDLKQPEYGSPDVIYLEGNSLDFDERYVQKANRVMVVLDSDHDKEHVAAEIKKFAPLVSKGCYLVVEDTFISQYLDNDDPNNDYSNGSSWEAIQEWDKEGFESVDLSMTLSMNPGGWFKRVEA
jgi:cephalosporin hydroxylase